MNIETPHCDQVARIRARYAADDYRTFAYTVIHADHAQAREDCRTLLIHTDAQANKIRDLQESLKYAEGRLTRLLFSEIGAIFGQFDLGVSLPGINVLPPQE